MIYHINKYKKVIIYEYNSNKLQVVCKQFANYITSLFDILSYNYLTQYG